MGTPPDPNAVRRNARVGPVRLPAQGRTKPAPIWPLGAQTAEEGELWAELWALPQAVEWERLKWTRIVARYARLLLKSEAEFAKDLLTHCLALEDRLGLTPRAMRGLMWTVTVDEVAVKREESQQRTSARGRLTVAG